MLSFFPGTRSTSIIETWRQRKESDWLLQQQSAYAFMSDCQEAREWWKYESGDCSAFWERNRYMRKIDFHFHLVALSWREYKKVVKKLDKINCVYWKYLRALSYASEPRSVWDRDRLRPWCRSMRSHSVVDITHQYYRSQTLFVSLHSLVVL